MGRGGGGLTGCIFCLLVDGPTISRTDKWGVGHLKADISGKLKVWHCLLHLVGTMPRNLTPISGTLIYFILFY